MTNCGQDSVCATPPGCARHWEERNRELIAERDEALRDWRGEREALDACVVDCNAMQDKRDALQAELDGMYGRGPTAYIELGEKLAVMAAERDSWRRESDERDETITALRHCLQETEAERDEALRQALEDALQDMRESCWCIPDDPSFEPCGPCLIRARINGLTPASKDDP